MMQNSRQGNAGKAYRAIGALVAVLVVALCGASPGAAQSSAIRSGIAANPEEGIVVGPFLFSPAVELSWESRDNIFFTATNEVSSDVYLARARFMFELPIYDSYVRFSYSPQYRDYGNWDQSRPWTHYVDAAAAFELPSGLKLTAAYSFVSGSQETREIDPGGELVFGDRAFEKHLANLEVAYWMTPTDGLRVTGTLNDVSYTDAPQNLGGIDFFDYSRLGLGAGWLHQLSPTSVLDLSYRHEDFDATPRGSFFDQRDTTSEQLTLGLTGQLTPVLASELQVGWRTTEIDDGGTAGTEEFSSWVVSGSLTWEMAHGSSLVLDVLRWDYPSAYSTNAYYTATGGSLTYNLNRDRLFGSARLRLQNNDYEVGGRSDDITSYGLGLGYRFTNLLSLRGSYLYEQRESLEQYSYEANIFLLALVVGY